MSFTKPRGPIEKTVKSFAVGFGCGFLAFLLLSNILGEKWNLCVGECSGDTNWKGLVVRVGARDVPYLSEPSTYTATGVSAANTRSAFSTAGNTNSCPVGTLHILVIILSDPNGFDRRNTLRTTWLKATSRGFTYDAKFVIGTKNLTSNLTAMLNGEQSLLHDLIIFPNLVDDYRNLTRKMWLSMQWAYKSGQRFDFLVKADDDSYVRLDKLVATLRKLNCDDRLYWGYFVGCSVPQLAGKWAETRWNTCPHYLPYAMGGGYVMSRKVVGMIARHANRLRQYSNEDVTTGSWLAPYKLVRKHDLRFDVEAHRHGCNNNYIIAHKQLTRSDMEEKFNSLMVNGTLCTLEKEIRPAFVYNWTVPPMDCCKRKRHLPVLDIDP